jgi:hypothetical protein
MPMMHEEQKFCMPWNAPKKNKGKARGGKKKRLVVLGEAGEQKGALLKLWEPCGGGLGILARRYSTSQLQTSRWDSKASSFFLGSSPCHAEDQQRMWNGPSVTKGAVFFSMLSIHSITLVVARMLYFCVLLNTDMDQPLASLSLLCAGARSHLPWTSHREQLLLQLVGTNEELFPFHCSNSGQAKASGTEGRKENFPIQEEA